MVARAEDADVSANGEAVVHRRWAPARDPPLNDVNGTCPERAGSVHIDAPGRRSRACGAAGSSLGPVSGSSARVFVSHLSGIGVFDPAGDPLGKVRDLVVVLRHDREPPRVLGLVTEVPPRRRIFVPAQPPTVRRMTCWIW